MTDASGTQSWSANCVRAQSSPATFSVLGFSAPWLASETILRPGRPCINMSACRCQARGWMIPDRACAQAHSDPVVWLCLEAVGARGSCHSTGSTKRRHMSQTDHPEFRKALASALHWRLLVPGDRLRIVMCVFRLDTSSTSRCSLLPDRMGPLPLSCGPSSNAPSPGPFRTRHSLQVASHRLRS